MCWIADRWGQCGLHGPARHREWVPHDEGTLWPTRCPGFHGGTARPRTLTRQRGMTVVHALAFLRTRNQFRHKAPYVLFVFFIPGSRGMLGGIAFHCSLFYCGGSNTASVAWSVPNYPGPSASCTTCFLPLSDSSFASYVETTTRRWPVPRGALRGAVFPAKVTADFFCAGDVFLFFPSQTALTNEDNRGGGSAGFLKQHRPFPRAGQFIVCFRLDPQGSGVGGPINVSPAAFCLGFVSVSRIPSNSPWSESGKISRLMRRACLSYGKSPSRLVCFSSYVLWVPLTIWYMDFLEFPTAQTAGQVMSRCPA